MHSGNGFFSHGITNIKYCNPLFIKVLNCQHGYNYAIPAFQRIKVYQHIKVINTFQSCNSVDNENKILLYIHLLWRKIQNH